jgi:hypothetical protein
VAAWRGTGAASGPAGPGIYTCTDDKGRRLTSDRPIAECVSREQQILNRDGSVKGVHPAHADGRGAGRDREARDRKANAERMAQMEAVRRDKNLLAATRRAAHRKAREAALDTVRLAIKATEDRLKELQAERKPLDNEAEFYKGKRLPPKLKGQIDANDTASKRSARRPPTSRPS